MVPFVLAVVIAFVAIGNGIPQIKSEPVELVTEIGESPEELVAAGKKLFMGDRAQCLTCHSLGEDPKARCPNQEGLGQRASVQRPGMSASDYLVESVYNPNAYIVQGYPKNQMTPANKPPIALSHDEILAVVAYLYSMGGTTDEAFIEQARTSQGPWKKGLLTVEESGEEVMLPILPGDGARGLEVFETIGCVLCHRVTSEGGDVGPELTAIGGTQSGNYILESIIDPYKVIVKGYKQTVIIWEDDSRTDLYGVPVEWIPGKENPTQVRMSIASGDAVEDTGSGDDFFGEEEETDDFFGTEEETEESSDDFFGTEEEEEEETGGAKVEGADRIEQVIDLAGVAYIGDSVVAVETDDAFTRYAGEYVSGDEETGVVLSVLEKGQWVEKEVSATGISYMTVPVSTMPSDFADTMTPQQIFDVVAYLLEQKGKS
jgi:cytochrome c2/mono/diheme cytochrome c family protein